MAEIVIKLVNGELAGKTVQSLNKELREAKLAADKAKVGTQEWIDAHSKLDKVKGLQADLKKQIEGTTSSSDMLKAAWNRLPGAQFFNQVAQSFGLMKSGVGGLISSFGVLKTAIAATGIGLLVVLIGSLVAWFTKTEEGADKLKSVLYPLQVLFQKLMGILAELGGKVFKRLSEAFSDPIQAIKDLGNAILENILNRFRSIAVFGEGIMQLFKGNFKEGFKALADASIQMVTGITDATDKLNAVFTETKKIWNEAYDAGQRLLDLENAIEDAEVALVVTRAKLNVAASKAMEIARNTQKTDEERLTAAREFQNLVNQQTAAEMNFLKLKQQRLLLEQDLDGILTDDERLERAKMEADIIQLQADNIDKKKKARALEINIIEEIAKREADIAKNIAQLKAQAAQDGFDQEVAMVQQQTEEKIAALQGSEAQILEQKMLLKEIEEQQLIAIGEKYQAINNENYKKAKADQEKIDKEALKSKQAVADAEAQIEAMKIETVQSTTAGLGELIGSQIKNEKAARAAKRSFALADIGMNLQQEMAANAAAGAKISAQFPPATIPAGIAYTAGANIKSFIRAGFATAKVLLFKKQGGLLRGPSHEQGGIPGVISSTQQPVEMEGDEFIFSGKAVRAIGADRLTKINDHFTKKMATGGPIDVFQGRDPISSGSIDNQISAMRSMVMMLVESNDRRIDRIKVQNVVTETRDAIDVVNKIQADADV